MDGWMFPVVKNDRNGEDVFYGLITRCVGWMDGWVGG